MFSISKDATAVTSGPSEVAIVETVGILLFPDDFLKLTQQLQIRTITVFILPL